MTFIASVIFTVLGILFVLFVFSSLHALDVEIENLNNEISTLHYELDKLSEEQRNKA